MFPAQCNPFAYASVICINHLLSHPVSGSRVITPLTYQILMALADADRHGYGIIKEIECQMGPGAAPSTGALYLALQRMEQDGLVQEAPARPKEDDARRRYYRLTRSGRAAAVEESARLAALVKIARQKKLLTRGADA